MIQLILLIMVIILLWSIVKGKGGAYRGKNEPKDNSSSSLARVVGLKLGKMLRSFIEGFKEGKGG